jgi:hypothetical protein
MDKIKLPSMVEYVKLQKENLKDYSLLSLSRKFELCDNFSNFLSQQPNIGMFVPAVEENGEWRVLSEPKTPHTFGSENADLYLKKWKSEKEQYQTALDNVIFEGCEYSDKELFLDGNLFWVFLNKLNFEKGLTIEQLTPHNLTLTPKFAKELGLI